MKNVKLSNGVEMPILGFGVYQIPDEAECTAAVSSALEVGYRSIDTAAVYRNEGAVGNAIASSGIARDELFITSKLWIDQAGDTATLRAFDLALSKLKVDYLDLYLIHQPYGDIYGAWRALEKLYAEGRVRAIGVSNFYEDRLVDLIVQNEVAPHLNQIETHPFFQRTEYQTLLVERGVQLESWGPFAEGKNDLFTNPLLAEIGAGYGKTVAQVVLRWMIQRDIVVIPKTVSPARMAENFNVFDFELSAGDMAKITTLDTGASLFLDHRTPEMAQQMGGFKLGF